MADIRPKLLRARDLASAGQLAQARDLIQQALRQAPDDVSGNLLMRAVLSRLGEYPRALYFAERAAAAGPANSTVLTELANALGEAGRTDEAIQTLHRALALNPTDLRARVTLATALRLHSRLSEQMAVCRDGLVLRPGQRDLTTQLAGALVQFGQADEALDMLEPVSMALPADADLADQVASISTWAASAPPERILAAHQRYAAALRGGLLASMDAPHAVDPNPDRPLRIGLLSADLRSHPMQYFMESWLADRDRARLDVRVYFNHPQFDPVSHRLRSHLDSPEAWRGVHSLSDDRLAELIRADGIDILVDLAGHTQGHRLPVFARRAAPVQMTFLGYPQTTGLDAIDYRIADTLTDPPGAERWSTERLLRLNPCHFCYTPPIWEAGAPAVALPPSQRTDSAGGGGRGTITFGSFTSLQKINGPLLATWAAILARVPGSRLLLKNLNFTHAAVREAFAARMAACGIDPARTILEPPALGSQALLPHYERIDIVLDSYPYAGMTSTCESLFMGVPVVTMYGPSSQSRFGLCILTNAGLHELAASTVERYIAAAADLALDPARLAHLRATLRPRLLASPVCDRPGYARRLESALRAAWQARGDGPSAART